MCCCSLQAPCLTAIRSAKGYVDCSYAKLIPFMSQIYLRVLRSEPEVASIFKETCNCIAMCAQIIPQKAKPLSSFTHEEGMKLLMGPNYQEAETKPFALADLKTSARLDDAVMQVTNLVFVFT